MKPRNPILLSIEDAGAIETPGAPVATPPEPAAPSTPDTVSDVINDLRDSYQAQSGTVELSALPSAEQPQAAPEPSTPEQPKEASEHAPPPAEPAQAEPAASEGEPAIPSPESRLAPLFQLASLPPDEAMPQAVDVLVGLYNHDPIAYGLLANAVINASPQAARAIVLEQMGVTADKVGEFNKWISSGTPALPEPQEYPAFDEMLQDAGKDADGNQLIRLPDGRVLNSAKQDDVDRYNLAKLLYETDVEKKKGEQQKRAADEEKRVSDERAAQQQARQDLTSRADFYESARYGYADSLIQPAIASLAPEDKLMGDMFKAHARTVIDSHPEIQKLGREAARYVEAGYGFTKTPDGKWQMTGRVAELAQAQDRIIRVELNKLKDNFSKELLRRNRAEIAATVGQPHLPPGTKTVESAAPAMPGLQSANTLQEILEQARDYDRRAATGH